MPATSEMRVPPKNGGLPTIASNPALSRANTSGNSICQWNVEIGWLPATNCRCRNASSARRRRPAIHSPAWAYRSFRSCSRLGGLSRSKKASTAKSPRRRTSSVAASARRSNAVSSGSVAASGALRMLSRRTWASISFSRMRKELNPGWGGLFGSQWKDSIWSRVRPTSESPCLMAWSRNVNGWSLARVASHRDSLARSTAMGLRSTPYRHRWATNRRA